MIDFTPQLSREYSKLIESEGPTQEAVDAKAREVLRSLTAADIAEELYEIAPEIQRLMLAGDTAALGKAVHAALDGYCQRIAYRMLAE